jgi:hypothetical protein
VESGVINPSKELMQACLQQGGEGDSPACLKEGYQQ